MCVSIRVYDRGIGMPYACRHVCMLPYRIIFIASSSSSSSVHHLHCFIVIISDAAAPTHRGINRPGRGDTLTAGDTPRGGVNLGPPGGALAEKGRGVAVARVRGGRARVNPRLIPRHPSRLGFLGLPLNQKSITAKLFFEKIHGNALQNLYHTFSEFTWRVDHAILTSLTH